MKEEESNDIVLLQNKLMNLDSDNILQLKSFLNSKWKPSNIKDAIKMKNIQHIFSNANKYLSKVCAEYLDSLEFSDNIITDSESGLKVLRKSKSSIKSYNESEEVDNIMDDIIDIKYKMNKSVEKYEIELKKLNIKLEEAKKKAGYTEQETGNIYSVKF